jgi:sec-independent protein translocase protein TatC
MTFLEHLDEFRKRLVHSAIALVGGCAVAFGFIDQIYAFVMAPLVAKLPDGQRLIATEPTEPFLLYMKVGVLAGLLVASPFIMWQVWLFIAPGLYSHEKRLAIPFVLLTTVCFIAGAAFSHYVVFPVAFQFFASFTNQYLEYTPRIAPTFSLYVRMILAFGLVFQLPTVVLFLARLGLVTAGFLVKNIKYAVLAIFIVAAVITPTADVVTQSLMAAPMFVLYLISIGIAWAAGRRRGA